MPYIIHEETNYQLPAFQPIPFGSTIDFYPRVCSQTFWVEFSGSNARRKIANRADNYSIKGSVKRIEIHRGEEDPTTTIALWVRATSSESIDNLLRDLESIDRASCEAQCVRDFTFDDFDKRPRFHVCASGPKRTDHEQSMESASESSYDILSSQAGSADRRRLNRNRLK